MATAAATSCLQVKMYTKCDEILHLYRLVGFPVLGTGYYTRVPEQSFILVCLYSLLFELDVKC